MKRSSRLPTLALVVALIAVVISMTGGADAVAKIGKHLVVTRSIKNGAVTSAKVKDGSLTAADLAAGVIPASGSGKQVMLAQGSVASPPGTESPIAPFGLTPEGYTGAGIVMPSAVRLTDFHVQGNPQVGAASATIYVCRTVAGVSGTTCVDVCQLTGGASTCTSTGFVDLSEGGELSLGARSGPQGAYRSTVEIGYTLQRLQP